MAYRSRWYTDPNVIDLSSDVGRVVAEGLLTIDQASMKSGCSVNTLRDYLSRAPILDPSVARRFVCRPYARMGNQPFYSPAQIERYLELQDGAANWKNRAKRTDWSDQKLVSPEHRDQYWTMYEISQRLRINGAQVREGTLRRWADREEFPAAFGMKPSDSQAKTPITIYEKEAALKWMKALARSRDDITVVAQP